MHVTNGLAQLAHKVTLQRIKDKISAQKRDIRSVIDSLEKEADEVVRDEATAELVQKYKDLSDPERIQQEYRSSASLLVNRLLAKKIELPQQPVPPVRKDIWELVVVKNDKTNFDKHMDACVKQTFNWVRFIVPGAEFARPEDIKDPHMQGLWCLDRSRYPDACCWDETLKNIQDDIDRVKDGWSVDPLAWAADCRDRRITACAEILEITKNEFAASIPDDLDEYWSTHHTNDAV